MIPYTPSLQGAPLGPRRLEWCHPSSALKWLCSSLHTEVAFPAMTHSVGRARASWSNSQRQMTTDSDCGNKDTYTHTQCHMCPPTLTPAHIHSCPHSHVPPMSSQDPQDWSYIGADGAQRGSTLVPRRPRVSPPTPPLLDGAQGRLDLTWDPLLRKMCSQVASLRVVSQLCSALLSPLCTVQQNCPPVPCCHSYKQP